MKIRRVMAVMLSLLMIAGVFCMPTAFAATGNFFEEEAAALDQQAYDGDDLGAVYTPESTTFKVWAPTASDVKLNLYTTGSDSEEGAAKISTTDMTYTEENGIWAATVEGDQKNVYYTYSVTNDGTTREVVDVYAKAVGVNGDRGMVVDLDSTDPEGWEDDNYVLVQNQTDASVWEVHVKDFSYDPESGISEANRGKYLAFTETGTTYKSEGKYKTGIDYLKELGVKYVHINPFYDFGSIDETGDDTQFNWGYDPKNYNVPEGSYSTNPYDGNVRINEVKQMVKALHDNGIGIIMDVVYNHTYVTDSWFQQTVPYYYYRFGADANTWSSASGCGNDTASEREMYRKYMVESVKYWADEYHIDGFRFDLMGLHDSQTMNEIRAALDEIDTRLLMYGEGWDMSSTSTDADCPPLASQKNSASLSERIGFFNDEIRDGIKGSVFNATEKGYIQGNNSKVSAVKNGIKANVGGGAWTSKAPTQTVTYASAHDNHTLYDRLVNSVKGEVAENYPQRYEDLVAMNKLNAAIVYSSQGIPFILAGEEFARTKYGDHNSYMSSADINMLDWSRVVEYKDLVAYYSGMIELRNNYAPFRDPTTNTVKNNMKDITGVPTGVIAYTIYDETQPWKTVAVCFNNNAEAQEVTLQSNGALPTDWVIVANDQSAGVKNLGEVSGSTVTVPASSALILVDKESFDTAAIPSTKGQVTINHVEAQSGDVLSTDVLTGTIGTYFEATPDSSLALRYDVVSAPEETSGTFTEEDQTLTYTYELYTLKAQDITGDGDVSTEDVLLLQKAIARQEQLTEEQQTVADVNCDGELSVEDVLIYQKTIAKVFVNGIGTVTVNYLDSETGEKVADPTVLEGRTGQSYQTEAKSVPYYDLDETKLPENEAGLFTNGDTQVNYYYNEAKISRTVYVKLQEGATWTPTLHAWDDYNGFLLGDWPGTEMTLQDDGWYAITVECGGVFSCVLSIGGANANTAQTNDITDVDSDIWIVMNVERPNKQSSDYTLYTSKPE